MNVAAKAIEATRSFLNPETQEEMHRRIIGVLIACIAIVFMALVVSKWEETRSSLYLKFGESVIKLSPDNNYVIYRFVDK